MTRFVFIMAFLAVTCSSFAIGASDPETPTPTPSPDSSITTGTVSVERISSRDSMVSYVVEWVASHNGAVVASPLTVFGVLRGVTIKSDAGTSAPTTSYDMTLLDDMGLDIAQGVGIDIDASATTGTIAVDAATSLTVPVVGRLDLMINNAGDNARGWIELVFDNMQEYARDIGYDGHRGN